MKIKGSWVLILIMFSIMSYLLWGYEVYRIVIGASYVIYTIMIFFTLLIEVYENKRVEINDLKLISIKRTIFLPIVIYYTSILVWLFLILRLIFIFFDKHLTFNIGNVDKE